MDKHTTGPQASTRHGKDRRPSYNTKAARSIFALEQRIAQLEGRQAASSQNARSTAATDLDTDLNSFGQMFNGLEERITELEKTDDGPTDLQARLGDIEERLKPYEDYQKQALQAVQQLKDFQERMRSAGSAKVDAGTAKLVGEHEASIREFSGRLLELEDQNELAKAQPLSTADLAKALLYRLKRGDVLAPTLSRDLRLLLDGVSDSNNQEPIISAPTRLPDTPGTDEGEVRQEDTLEAPVEDEERPSQKRRQIKQMPPTPKVAKRRHESEPAATLQCEDALSGFKSGDLAIDDEADDGAAGDVDMEDVVIPPEVRRTSRQPKPTKRGKDMLHWKEANRRLQGMRMSLA